MTPTDKLSEIKETKFGIDYGIGPVYHYWPPDPPTSYVQPQSLLSDRKNSCSAGASLSIAIVLFVILLILDIFFR